MGIFLRFGQRDTAILMTSSLKNPAEQQEEDARRPGEPAELRSVFNVDWVADVKQGLKG